MKKFKIILFGLLAIFGFFLNSENYQDYLRSFENGNDYVTMYSPPEVENQEMIDDLLSAAQKNDVSFFVSEYSNSSTFSAQKNIYYSSEEVVDLINNKYDIFEGTYKSILCGKTDVIFNDISSINNLPTYNYFWIFGDKDNQIQFKKELVSKYGGSVPREGFSVDGTVKNCIRVWLMLFSVSLLFSFYQILSDKKEALVRTIYGESLGLYIGKSILFDSLMYSITFSVIYFFMSSFCYVKFCIKYVVLLFGCLLIINALLHLNMLRFNLKKDLSKSKQSSHHLILCYILKLVISVVTISIVTVNGSVVLEGIKYYTQKDFFESRSEFSYVQNKIKFSESNEDNLLINAKYRYSFYQHFTGEGKAVMQVYLGDIKYSNNNYPIVYINKNNLKYLLDRIPELNADLFSENKVYYLFPSNISNASDFDSVLKETDDWVRWNLEMHYNYSYQYSIINYRNSISMIALSNRFELRSDYLINPIIAYNNRDESQDNYEITSDIRDIYDKDIMYDVSEDEIIELEKESGYNPAQFFLEIHNVYDDFQNNMIIVKRIGYINTVISVLVILLNIIITAIIISLEYSINKIELAVKKTIGYSRSERFKKLHFISGITTVIGTISFICINKAMHLTSSGMILICGLVILFFDLIIIMTFTRKADKDQIHKILNGG